MEEKMNKEQEKLARFEAKLAVMTIQHMAKQAKVPFGEMTAAIASGGAAAKRFEGFIKLAQAYLKDEQ
jgi:phage shock protein A